VFDSVEFTKTAIWKLQNCIGEFCVYITWQGIKVCVTSSVDKVYCLWCFEYFSLHYSLFCFKSLTIKFSKICCVIINPEFVYKRFAVLQRPIWITGLTAIQGWSV